MKKIYKILTVVGTRPEIIKLSSVIKKFDKYFSHILVHTGQNYDYTLNEIFFKEFNLKKPKYFLNAAGSSSTQTISNVISKSEKVFLIEKPDATEAPSNLAVIGRYILTPDIFDIIRSTPPGRNGEVQLTDALQVQASEGRVLAYQFDGLRFDCGSVPGFVEATQHVYEHYYGQS